MIKVIAAARRRAGMTHAEYCRYVEEVHGGLARANSVGLERYIQNHVFDGAFGRTGDVENSPVFHRDSVTELFFPNMERLVETFAHPYTRDVIGPDGPNFSEMGANITLLVAEEAVTAPPRAWSGVKAMLFLKAAAGVSGFAGRLRDADAATRSGQPELAGGAAGHVLSLPLDGEADESGAGASFFSGGTMPRFDGVVSVWLDDEASLPLFRRYEAALMDRLGAAVDRAMCFFVYAREVVIFDHRPASS